MYKSKIILTTRTCIGLIAVMISGKLTQSLPEPEKSSKTAPLYKARTFDFEGIPFLSEEQKQQHYKLYEGYVKKLNEIRSKLPEAAYDSGITYSPYRALKIAETFALNGVLLHEYYFENICNGADTKPQEVLLKLITEQFGSLDSFIEDLKHAAGCARGWVLTGYTLSDGHIYNYVLDAHNETVPVLTIPLIIVDVYEHAYFMDFGTNRTEYIKLLINNLNWNVIENRAQKLMNMIKN
ncbi:MAG: Fe-Mn family superoxide dismutase [Candidatus Dependentiae bacterium]|nr:Fe-Mn family superoxide dismutase [Candidatus Dependentiae bacterium]